MSKRKWEPDRPYCPHCRDDKWRWEREDGECEDCGTELQDEWPASAYYKHLSKEGIAFGVWGLILFGPPLIALGLIVEGVLTGETLVAYETTTIQVPTLTGVLFNAGNWVVLAMLIWLIVLAMYVAPRP